MKLKMSEKSLFAILLRSPWWVSVLIVLGFALVGGALLPRDYAVAVVLGTFPFMVIAAMAAWRQFNAPSAARLAETLAHASTMSWRGFAAAIEQVLQQQGYRVQRLDGSGADFRIERQDRVLVLSCRRWKAASHGVEVLRELEAARQEQGAQQATYISLLPVTDAARQYAQGVALRLIHGDELASLLLQAGGKSAL